MLTLGPSPKPLRLRIHALLALVAATLVSVAACESSSRTPRVTTPPVNPPVPGIPPGIAGTEVAGKRFQGTAQVTFQSGIAGVMDFGPAPVDITAVVSGNPQAGAPDVFFITVVPEAAGLSPPLFIIDAQFSDGELSFSLDLDDLCGGPLDATVAGSVNPEDTINVEALDVAGTCDGNSVSFAMPAFELNEVP